MDITGDCLAPPLSRVKQVRVTFLASFSFFGYSFSFEQVIIWKKTDYREKKKKTKLFIFIFSIVRLCLFLWRILGALMYCHVIWLKDELFLFIFSSCKNNGNHLPLVPGKFRFHSLGLAYEVPSCILMWKMDMNTNVFDSKLMCSSQVIREPAIESCWTPRFPILFGTICLLYEACVELFSQDSPNQCKSCFQKAWCSFEGLTEYRIREMTEK